LIHPLTPGLLASIAMRANHAMFLPAGMEMIGMGSWESRIPEGLRRARASYDEARAGTLTDVQLLEETDGRGFYSPEHEDYYLSLLAGFPGMTDLARSLAGSWDGDAAIQ
jgi:hypothetical protein